MHTREITHLIKALGAWSAGRPPLVQAWAKTIQQNLRRLRRWPSERGLREQTAKNVQALQRARR